MDKQKWRVVKGFILVPIILSVIFALSLSLSVLFAESDHSKVSLFFVGIVGWFIHALPFALVIILLVGVPGYLLLKQLDYKELKQYLISGLSVGILLPFAAIFYFGNIEWWIYFISAAFGLMAAFIFWHLSIKPY